VCDPSSSNGYRPNSPMCASLLSNDTSTQVCARVTGHSCASEWCTNPNYIKKQVCRGRDC
jgi:hypothetical protein